MPDAKNRDLRMPDLNRVFLSGRLTRDPELRYTSQGTAVCKFGLAVSRNYKTRDGERKEDTTFVNVEVWDKAAEWVGEHMKKDYPVLVEGSLRSSQWEDKNTGQKRTSLDVRAQRVQQLDWANVNTGKGGQQEAARTAPEPAAVGPVPEDDIPF